jgi:hypothetical protein
VNVWLYSIILPLVGNLGWRLYRKGELLLTKLKEDDARMSSLLEKIVDFYEKYILLITSNVRYVLLFLILWGEKSVLYPMVHDIF